MDGRKGAKLQAKQWFLSRWVPGSRKQQLVPSIIVGRGASGPRWDSPSILGTASPELLQAFLSWLCNSLSFPTTDCAFSPQNRTQCWEGFRDYLLNYIIGGVDETLKSFWALSFLVTYPSCHPSSNPALRDPCNALREAQEHTSNIQACPAGLRRKQAMAPGGKCHKRGL